jgi:hypothetical protein
VRSFLASIFAVAALALSASAGAATTLTLRVSGSASSRSTSTCFLLLTGHVVGGGRESYCLKTFAGRPGPRATVRDSGTMRFTRKGWSLVARVRIVQRFGADGAHAHQTLRGTVTGGTGRFRGARGTIAGGGTDVERPPGHIVRSSLRYVIRLR